MAHLLSIFLFSSLLIGLAILLQRSLWDGRSAIRAALLGGGSCENVQLPRTALAVGERTEDVQLPRTALERVGTCLRASFPPVAGALNDEMDRLLGRISQDAPYRPGQLAMA